MTHNSAVAERKKVASVGTESEIKERLMDYLFNGLNEKLNPIGLSIAGATLGFRKGQNASNLFDRLKAAKIV